MTTGLMNVSVASARAETSASSPAMPRTGERDPVAGDHQGGRDLRAAVRPLGGHADDPLALAQQAGDGVAVAHRHALGEGVEQDADLDADRHRGPVGAGRDVPSARAHPLQQIELGEGVEALEAEHEGAGQVGPGRGALQDHRLVVARAQQPGQRQADHPAAHDDHARHGHERTPRGGAGDRRPPRPDGIGSTAVTSPLPSTSDTVLATRYVAPLREGGSLPGLVEGDDDGLWVVKFRGAGQAPKSLVAEWLAGELGRALGLPIPEMRRVLIDPELAMAEPDQEIQDLLRASPGLNLGIDYLPGSLNFDPAAGRRIDRELAADTVWFDSLVTNVDRRPPNPNLLMWHERLWLIDHGAAFYAHHGDWRLEDAWRRPFPMIADHVLMSAAGPITEADDRLGTRLGPETVAAIVAALPDEWLDDEPAATPDERREAYLRHILGRLGTPRGFADEAEALRRAA